MAGVRAYYRTVWQRTRADLWPHLREQVVVGLVVALASGMIALAVGAGPSSIVFAIAGAGVYAFGATAYYGIRAPAELHAESQQQVAAMAPATAVLPWSDFSALVADAIAAGESIVTRLKAAQKVDEVASLESELADWEQTTRARLTSASPARATHFGTDTLAYHLGNASPTQINDRDYWLMFLQAKLHRLKVMIDVVTEADDAEVAVTTNAAFAAVAESAGDRVILRLVHSRHFSSATLDVDEAYATVHLPDYAVRSRSFGPLSLAADEVLEAVYPRDFANAQWPLEPGVHEATWYVRYPDGSSLGTGCRIRIRS